MALSEASVQSACGENNACQNPEHEQEVGSTHSEISTSVALCHVRQVVEKRRSEGRLPRLGVDLQDLASGELVRQREEKLPIEPSRPSKGGVDSVRSVGRSNDDNLSSTVHAVHEGEQGRNDAGVDLILFAASYRSQTCENRCKARQFRSSRR